MALSLEKIKRDFAKNQKRTAILGVLVLVLVGFSVKAYFEMSPSQASADTGAAVPVDASGAAVSADVQLTAAESEARIRQSKQLWTALREVKKDAIVPANAFAFTAENFPEDPNRPRPHFMDSGSDKGTQTITSVARDLDPEKRLAEATARASHITIMSTVLGAKNENAVVLLNVARERLPGQQGIYKVGEVVDGFEIVAIQSRKIVLRMQNVVVTKTMSGKDEVVLERANNSGGAEPSLK